MKFGTVLTIYNLLMPLAFLVTIPGYLVKMFRRGNYGRNFWQRFGIYSEESRRQLFSAPPIWVHAVSVGEVFIALKLIKALRKAAPEQPLVLSCTTSTGYQLAVQKCGGEYTPLYNPLDFPLAVDCAFAAIQPRLLVLVEAEMWPNLLWKARQNSCPVLLVNARLSPRSERRFRKFQALTRSMFQELESVVVTADADVARWAGLGVEQERISWAGSIKYDEEGHGVNTRHVEDFRTILNGLRGEKHGPVILAGSTHAGEEAWMARKFMELRQHHPDAFLIIVPRHWERGGSVARDLAAAGLDPVLRTELEAGASTQELQSPALIVNTTGELRAWYQLADVVLIGKSFLAEGGQNPVEPILAGKAVVMGPNMQNFGGLLDELNAVKGCVQLNDPERLVPELQTLLSDQDACAAMAARGREVVDRDQGAARRTAASILGHLGNPEKE